MYTFHVRVMLLKRVRAVLAKKTPVETTLEKRLWSSPALLDTRLDAFGQKHAAVKDELTCGVVIVVPVNFLHMG